jgi:hypothetical protein
MKMKLIGSVFLASAMVCGAGAFSFAQTAGQDMKNAGHETKEAAKDTGRGIKKGTKTGYHKTKRGTKKVVHKTARATEHGAEKVEDKTAPR